MEKKTTTRKLEKEITGRRKEPREKEVARKHGK